MKTPLNSLVSFPPTSSCLDGESIKAEWWFGPFFPARPRPARELCVGSSGSGGAPSGRSTGQDIYHRLPRLTRGSARSVMELSCLFNPRHMRVTRANPVGRRKPCCVFVEQLLGSWCTAVAGLVWKWRVTWSFNLFFFLLLLSPPLRRLILQITTVSEGYLPVRLKCVF